MNRREMMAAAMLGAITPYLGAHAKRPRILLKSGWQTVNIGDIGHTPGMLAWFEKFLPGVDVTLWPNDIGEGVRPMLAGRFPKVAIAQTADEVKGAFEACDFLLHSSGPSLVAGRHLATWHEKTKKPYGVMGITLGTLDDTARTTLDTAKFLYLRDTLSLAFAKSQKLTTPVIAYAPDSAFGVDLRNDIKAAVFMKKHGLEENKFLCVIPKYRNTPYWLIRNKPMTDSDRAKDKVNQALKESDFSKVRPAVIEFLKTTPHKVLLCPEDKSHIAINKEMFLDKLPDDLKSRVVWKSDYWLTDEAMSVYVKSLGLLSMDMHSPIMAVGNGVPAIHCRFKEQTTKGQMWADIGLGDWLFNLDDETDGSRITMAVTAMVNDRLATLKKAEAALAFVHKSAAEAFGVLAKAVA
jgi:polysaccharide pyruvyl transferase WcaK-like protein